MSVSHDAIMAALNWRYAVKKFDPTKKISEADWKVLEESLRLSPSSYGLQPWKFLVIRDPKTRELLKAQSWNQTQVTESSHYVVLVTRTEMTEADVQRFIDRVADVRGVGKETLDGYKKGIIGDVIKGPRSTIIKAWAQRQSYIAMGFLMKTAALLGIDTCPMEGLDPAAYDQILKLEGTGYATVAAVACGYRHADDKMQKVKKVRYNREEVFEDR